MPQVNPTFDVKAILDNVNMSETDFAMLAALSTSMYNLTGTLREFPSRLPRGKWKVKDYVAPPESTQIFETPQHPYVRDTPDLKHEIHFPGAISIRVTFDDQSATAGDHYVSFYTTEAAADEYDEGEAISVEFNGNDIRLFRGTYDPG